MSKLALSQACLEDTQILIHKRGKPSADEQIEL